MKVSLINSNLADLNRRQQLYTLVGFICHFLLFQSWHIYNLIFYFFLRNKADGESQPLLQQQQGQQQQQLAPLQDSYMQSRNQALHSVESTIHELSSIFTQLATMVSQQGELAIRLVSLCFHMKICSWLLTCLFSILYKAQVVRL